MINNLLSKGLSGLDNISVGEDSMDETARTKSSSALKVKSSLEDHTVPRRTHSATAVIDQHQRKSGSKKPGATAAQLTNGSGRLQFMGRVSLEPDNDSMRQRINVAVNF